jgi:hypothetical protein
LLLLLLQAANNNFDPVPVKNSSRGMSYLRRAAAAPVKPKSPMTAKYHPYHMGASSAVLAAAAQPGGGFGLGRATGSSLSSSSMAAAYSTKQHTSYAAFAALPRPHSSQSMGAMDGLTLAAGLRGTSAAAAAGLPSSLLSYGGLGATSYASSSMLGQGMLPEQLLRLPSSVKQDQHQLQLGDAGLSDPAAAAAGMYSSYTAGSSFAGLPGGISSTAGDWQANSASPAMHLAAGTGLDEGVTRIPSRLQHAGLPGLSMPVQRGTSLTFPSGHQGLAQQVLQQQHQQSRQQQGLEPPSKMHSSSHIGLPVFDKMPSLPDPTAEPCILDGCGDGDGTSLRGIFSSDDGEPFGASPQQQQDLAAAHTKLPLLQQQGSGSHQLQPTGQFLGGCMDLGAAAAATSSQQHGSPTGQQLHVAAYASPNSFTSGCSPVPLSQSMLMQQQPQQHTSTAAAAEPAAGAASDSFKHSMQLKIECTAGAAGYDAHVVAGGERGALSAPCTVTAAYTPSGYQQQQQQHMLPQGAFTQGGQQQQQQSLLPQTCSQQQGRYTPFQHPENQQQHMNHICQDQGRAAQQHQQQLAQPAAAYQPALACGLPGYDSGSSSHHHQQQPGQGQPSPSTIAASAVAAVTRGCGLTGAAAQSWGSSPTSIAHQQPRQMPQLMQQQQLGAHHLIAQVVSDDQDHELGQLVDLLDGGDGDCSGDGCGSGHHTGHHGLGHVDGDCGLMLSDGDFDNDALPADYLPGLPGLKRQNSELEMMAAAACW